MAKDVGEDWNPWLSSGLEDLVRGNRLRSLAALRPLDGLRVDRDGESLLLFSTNDYLGLSSHPAVRGAAAEAAERHGLGPRASALVCGYTEAHAALEEELAVLKETEAALLFPTGYAANTGTLGALAGDDLTIFSDALNHASIIDGCRLATRAGSQVKVYRHADIGHLEELLGRCQRSRRLIVSDSLFSMDGDVAPLADLVRVKERFGAWLMLDEAHATLVYGVRGGGVAEAAGVAPQVDIHVGTLSKAFGSQGGFVAGSHELRQWLINRGRSQVFSTALPQPIVAAAREALAVRQREPDLVATLWRHVSRFAATLGLSGASPILPVIVGGEERALRFSDRLREEGLWVPAIRPPTVPAGTSRLRVTISALHREEEIARLASSIVDLGSSLDED